ncbi:hypothetical protein AXG93_857s1410 [Marchantia polymorpha subsp. ruderalis]|uniref:Uncharacterized protein n=1 Tax=Marchantia polymorpha subsp. ruderalis TaxID=1480154 RepID=A0A176WCA4_MARPO|nr:hypothetical protein AXG93_857s1410 [Marchantia polymorpha subsp. ruderalis]
MEDDDDAVVGDDDFLGAVDEEVVQEKYREARENNQHAREPESPMKQSVAVTLPRLWLLLPALSQDAVGHSFGESIPRLKLQYCNLSRVKAQSVTVSEKPYPGCSYFILSRVRAQRSQFRETIPSGCFNLSHVPDQ